MTEPENDKNPGQAPDADAANVSVKATAAGALAFFSGFGALIAAVDSKALTRLLVVVFLLAFIGNARRIDIQIRCGKYLRPPGEIPAGYATDKESRERMSSAQQSLNRHVAADIVVTALGIAVGLAIFACPGAPVLCKAIPEALLGGAFFYIAFSAVGHRKKLPYLKSGTELAKKSPHVAHLYDQGEDEFDGSPEPEPTFAPARWLYRFLTKTQRSTRTSMMVLASAVVLLAIPLAELAAYVGRDVRGIVSPDKPGEPVTQSASEDDDKDRSEGEQRSGEGERQGSQEEPRQARPQECATYMEAGRGAPAEQRSELHGLWNGRPASDDVEAIVGFGWSIAGCPPGHARKVKGQAGVWYETGFCGSDLRGLGVAAPSGPAMLFQQAAEFGFVEADAGRLRGAYPRQRVGSGDFYVVDVELEDGSTGSYVLIRSQNGRGTAPASASSSQCEEPGDVNVAYTVVTPGLLPLWRWLVREKGWAWPDDGGTHYPARQEVSFAAEQPVAGEQPVLARCVTPSDCTLTADGTSYETDDVPGGDDLTTTPDEIAALGPEPAAAP